MKDKVMETVNEKVEKKLEEYSEQELNPQNIEQIYKLVDIHKDIANECYWKEKEENMRYRGYGANATSGMYGTTAIGNYSNHGNYGRMRDANGRYMGGEAERKSEEFLEALNEHYGNYAASSNSYSRGNYGAQQDSMQSLNAMLESVVDFIAMLKREAKTPDEMDLIKRYAMTISEM